MDQISRYTFRNLFLIPAVPYTTVSEKEGKPTKLILSFRMVCPSFDIFKKALKELEADGFKVKETLTGDFLVMKGE